MGYAKKALDLAIRAEKVEEFFNVVQSTEQSNETEIQKVTKAFNNNVSTLQDSETKVRRCYKYKQVGHYAPTCPNVNK
ncbi:18725_t:CDS:2 [Gigaspora rosea]|nr:18725_t:CDS:2 [Gigaspora rosea]